MSDVNGPPGYEPVGMGSPRPADLNGVPAAGSLGIKEKRTWKTWQLGVAVIVAVLLGMLINYRTVGATDSGKTGSSGGGGAYTLPPEGGSSTSTTAVAGSGSTSTTAAGGVVTTTTSATSWGKSKDTTTTTAAGSSTTSTTSSTTATTTPPARLLLGPMQSQGNWTSPAFTITAPSWNIGWAFQCSPVPTAGTSFQVFVTQAGASPGGAAAISETGGSGQAVTAQSSLGKQTLVVEAPANCAWAVKVTGS
jgi:hypothetical protein